MVFVLFWSTYNPADVKKTAAILASGGVMNRKFQAFEAHIPYLAQFFIDFNLLGMDFIDLADVRFRLPLLLKRVIYQKRVPALHFTDESVAESLKWPTSSKIRRQSWSELEMDCWPIDILNRARISERPTTALIRGNQGDTNLRVSTFAHLLKEEEKRHRKQGGNGILVKPDEDERNSSFEPWFNQSRDRDAIRKVLIEREMDELRSQSYLSQVSSLVNDGVMTAFQSIIYLSMPETRSKRVEDSQMSMMEDEEFNYFEETDAHDEESGHLLPNLKKGKQKNNGPAQDTVDIEDFVKYVKDPSFNLAEDPLMYTSSQVEEPFDISEMLLQIERRERDHGKGPSTTKLGSTSKDIPQLDGAVGGSSSTKRKRKRPPEEMSFRSSRKEQRFFKFEVQGSKHRSRNADVREAELNRPIENPQNLAFMSSIQDLWSPDRDNEEYLTDFGAVPDPQSPTDFRVSYPRKVDQPRLNTSTVQSTKPAYSSITPHNVTFSDNPPHVAPNSPEFITDTPPSSQEPNSQPIITPPKVLIPNTFKLAKRPPSAKHLLETLKMHGLPEVIYRQPFFSDPTDCPNKIREFAGRVFDYRNVEDPKTSQPEVVRHYNRSGDIIVDVEENEKKLFEKLIDRVRLYDPDILTGYEIHNSSWGYICERAQKAYGVDFLECLARVSTAANFKMDREDNPIPHFDSNDLCRWYRLGNLFRWRVVNYFLSRVQFNVMLLEDTSLISRTCEFARVYGMDFYSVLWRGSQFRVESILARITRPENFVMFTPTPEQIRNMRSVDCLPLILEPKSRLYTDPVLVHDYQSLYPSVMIAYNYCYSTCIGRVSNVGKKATLGVHDSFEVPLEIIQVLQDDLIISPNGVIFVKPHIRKGTLGRLLTEFLDTRVMVKDAMKRCKGQKALLRILDARQLSLKLLANVTYGYAGASFSGRMPCSDIADSIVQTGRCLLERAMLVVQRNFSTEAHVIYGDTDSMFTIIPGASKETAFRLGKTITKEVTRLTPHPVKLKFEKVYLPCILQTKKRYVGFMFEHLEDSKPTFDAKGIETVRRDGCPAVAKIVEASLKILFRSKDLSELKSYLLGQWTKILEDKVSYRDFIIATEVRMGHYKCVMIISNTSNSLGKK
ncbi:DNA polymerase zeta [Dinochytrium kinnereticum]|nr:DNA polymerase zeta [Dinochytrium kinnereticum]